MGFYSDTREEFYDIYGFYPKSDLLKLYINNPFECIVKMTNSFFENSKNENKILKMKEIFLKKYGFYPNKLDLYCFILCKKNEHFIPTKMFLSIILFLKEINFIDGYHINNFFKEYNIFKSCINKDLKYFILDLYNNKELRSNFINAFNKYNDIENKFDYETIFSDMKNNIDKKYTFEFEVFNDIYNYYNKATSFPSEFTMLLIYKYEVSRKEKTLKEIESGYYNGKTIHDFFEVFHYRGVKSVYYSWDRINSIDYSDDLSNLIIANFSKFLVKFIKNNNIEYICLPRTKSIKNISFTHDNMKLKICVPHNYISYFFKDNCEVILESLEFLTSNIEYNLSTNLNKIYDDLLNEFVSEFGFVPEKNILDSFINKTLNYNALKQKFSDAINYLINGTYSELQLNNVVEFFYNDLKDFDKLLSSLKLNKIYAPPIDNKFHIPRLPFKFDGTIIILKQFERIIAYPPYAARNRYDYKDKYKHKYSLFKINDYQETIEIISSLCEYSYELILENPHNVTQISSLAGTKFYIEYYNKYLKTHSLNEWKYLVAPESVKCDLNKDPNLKVSVIKSESDTWCVSDKLYWRDIFEGYIWSDKYLCWYYSYDSDYGSD